MQVELGRCRRLVLIISCIYEVFKVAAGNRSSAVAIAHVLVARCCYCPQVTFLQKTNEQAKEKFAYDLEDMQRMMEQALNKPPAAVPKEPLILPPIAPDPAAVLAARAEIAQLAGIDTSGFMDDFNKLKDMLGAIPAPAIPAPAPPAPNNAKAPSAKNITKKQPAQRKVGVK